MQTSKLAILLTFVYLSICVFVPNSVVAQSNTTSLPSPDVVVSATISEPKMILYGWGPPESDIRLTGIGIDEKTRSQTDGYFRFDSVFLPSELFGNPALEFFPEMCIFAITSKHSSTSPTCLPRLPLGPYLFDIGPVILAPSLEVGNNLSKGKTIPNSDIEIFMTSNYFIPIYRIRSDKFGDFSFNLPITKGNVWRIFAGTSFNGLGMSTKSNTLIFK